MSFSVMALPLRPLQRMKARFLFFSMSLTLGTIFLWLVLTPSFLNSPSGASSANVLSSEDVVSGELKKWHPVTIDFAGPVANEADDDPNPFLDFRLQVAFTGPNGQTYEAPGFFAGDGNGNGSGNVWRVRFTPDQAGQWRYVASFRAGSDVAVSLDADEGVATGFDGAGGAFLVAELDREAPDFLKWGRLEYVGDPYLKFSDGPYWLKGGANSPENFLAYQGFDDTLGSHRYEQHLADWREGDPDWGNGRGRAIIGALNYLAAQRVNSIYFLPMNIGGDGKDTWPFVDVTDPAGHARNDNLNYDISKLSQWDIVFAHAQRQGILLHFVLNEAEEANKRELDDGELGVERKLYYRELAARFGYHNALIWNLAEEYNADFPLDPGEVKAWAAYLRAVDPYDHPLTVHNNQGGEPATISPPQSFAPFWGDGRFDLLSVQFRPDQYDPAEWSYSDMIVLLRQMSEGAGRPLPVFMDEPDRAAVVDDASHQSDFPMLSGHTHLRKAILWPVYMAGGAGIEFILEDTINTEDFSRYENLWQYTWYARQFFEENLPFWQMEPADDLLSGEGTYHQEGGRVLAQAGERYAIYLPVAQPGGQLDVSRKTGCFRQRWYDPRTGQFDENKIVVAADGVVPLGQPPEKAQEDWALLLDSTWFGCFPLAIDWLMQRF